MKGFMLDDSGDVVITNKQIQMVEGDQLLCQTVKSVLGTNKGEWVFNIDEGINFRNITGKHKATTTLPKQNNVADVQRYYENEIKYIRDKENEDLKRLQKRLDGDGAQ